MFPGPVQLLIVGLVVLLLFGKRLPGAMRSLGSSLTEFKKGVKGIEDDIEEGTGKNENSDQPTSSSSST